MKLCIFRDKIITLNQKLLIQNLFNYRSINAGNNYENLKRCIVILITDYDLDKSKEILEYVSKWKIREEKYSKLVLTNDLELYIISLEKAKNSTRNKKEELYNWLKFINNPKEVTRNGR